MSSHFSIDPRTLSLVRHERDLWFWLRRSGAALLLGVLLGLLFFYLFTTWVPSPETRRLREDRDALTAQLTILQFRQAKAQAVLADLQQRDSCLYRVLFQAAPVAPDSLALRPAGYYDQIASMTASSLAAAVTRQADILEDELYAQARSYDQLFQLTKNQEARNQCLPAIQPVLNRKLRRLASGYGVRIDPVYHVKRFHQGIDFSAPVGTDIYATGDGKVIFVGWRQGYGNTVVLSHGFGYTTVYAHVYKSVVRTGQHVHRGDVIALVGNSGKSTGPHLHYEVRINDRPVDPRNYFFYDLTPAEYDRMLQITNNYGTIMD